MKTRYFLDNEGHHVAVTDETPRGPLKGFVFVGRRVIGEAVSEEAFGIDQLATWTKLDISDVPPRCLEALGYCEAPAPEPEPEPEPIPEPEPQEPEGDGVKEGEGQFPHGPKQIPKARYTGCALLVALYFASVLFFWWIKHA